MAQFFIEKKQLMYIIVLLLIALLFVCPSAYAQQTPEMTCAPTADFSADALEYIDFQTETDQIQTDRNEESRTAQSSDNTALTAGSERNASNEETDETEEESEKVSERSGGNEAPDEAPTETPTEVPTETQSPKPEQTPVMSTDAPQNAPTDTPTGTPKPTATPSPEPQVRFSRDFSGRYAEYGSYVTLSYTVRNDGVLPMTDITVRDGLLGKVGSLDQLDPGEKKTFSARVKVTQTCTSTPSISYEYADVQHTKYCSEKTIYLADVELEVDPSADKQKVSPGEYVTLRLRIVNRGNVNLYSLRVQEPMLGEIGSAVRLLEPGEECVVTRTVQMKSTASFHFLISGSSDTGSSFTMETEEIDVVVAPAAAQIEMKLSAQADRTRLDAPGEVCFSLKLNNQCVLELRDVLLSEETRGAVRTLAFVPSGEMPVIAHSCHVSESGVYRFMAQVVDAVGDQVTVYSEPIYIEVRGETVQQTASPEPVQTDAAHEVIEMPDGSPYRMAEEVATFEKLIVWTVLLLVGVLLLWYIVSNVRRFIRRRRRRRRRRNRNRASGRRAGGRGK